jgi:nucleotide-binding universal stress UspA family protein
MKSILIATDLSVRSDRALQRALNLAKNYKAKLTIFICD